MRIYTAITIICITFLLFGCKQNPTKNKSNTVVQKNNNPIIKKKTIKKTVLFLKEENCPCIMSRTEGRYGFISYKGSLVDNQKELVIKLCDNGNNNYALSLESSTDYDSIRGRVYDYKAFKTNEKYLEFNNCIIKNDIEGYENWDKLIFIFSSSSVVSKWRIKKGKLIELDKNKDFPCYDPEEEMPYEYNNK